MKQQKFNLITENTENAWFSGNPVHILKTQLLLDEELNQEFLICELLNACENTVSQVYLDIICYGEGGSILTAVKDAKISDVYALSHSTFGIDSPIKLPVANAVSVKTTVTKVAFEDAEPWRHEGGSGKVLPPAERAELPSALMAQFELECEREKVQSKYKFEEFSDYWNCSCGMHNENNRTECVLCGAKREWLREHFDISFLAAALEERLTAEKNERIRKNRENTYNKAVELAAKSTEGSLKKAAHMMLSVEGYLDSAVKAKEYEKAAEVIAKENAKKRRRNIIIITAVSVVIALCIAAVLTYLLYIVPSTKYQKAEELLTEQRFDEAKAGFADITGFSDADERVKECDYRKATALLAEQKYDEAKALFATVSDYSDASAKINECDYQLALIKLNGGSLEEAKQMFITLNSYKDSSTLAAECDYRKAKSLLNAAEYKAAAELFSDISHYNDSAEQLKNAKYQYVKQHYENADALCITYLNELKAEGYKDAQQLLAALSTWKAKIIYNDSKTDTKTDKISISINKAHYFHVTVDGGLPGATLNLRYEVTVHKTLKGVIENVKAGQTVTFGWDKDDKNYTAGSGNLTVKIYDNDTNELIASKSGIYVSQK